jgi:hypothetical protein
MKNLPRPMALIQLPIHSRTALENLLCSQALGQLLGDIMTVLFPKQKYCRKKDPLSRVLRLSVVRS